MKSSTRERRYPVKHRVQHHWVFHILFTLCFLVFVAIGLHVYRDYGVSIDEYSQIELGRVNYERVVSGSEALKTNEDRYYGPVFETVLYGLSHAVQKPLHIDEMSSRHLIEFLYFAASLVVFYLFLWKITGHPGYGLLGSVLLAISPRMFAESFYNSKDMVFLSTSIFALYSMSFVADLSFPAVIIHAVVSGFAIAVRPQGMLLVVVSVVGIFLISKKTILQKILWSSAYIVLTVVSTIAFFPVFWDGIPQNIAGFLHRSLDPIGVPTYYFGKFYTSPGVPWHHLVVWIGITSLLSVTVTSSIGLVWFLYRAYKEKQHRAKASGMFTLLFLIIIGTIGGAIIFRARTYDGWRHIYYLYPSIIGFSVYSVKRCMDLAKKNSRIWSIITVCILGLFVLDGVSAVRFMIRHHPNEYVYFNQLTGGYVQAKRNFDFDYWGISYKQILSYLLSLPRRPTKVYFVESFPYVQFGMAPALRTHGFTVVDSLTEADVVVVVNRYDKTIPSAGFTKLYAVDVEGADLSAVYATRAYRALLNDSPKMQYP